MDLKFCFITAQDDFKTRDLFAAKQISLMYLTALTKDLSKAFKDFVKSEFVCLIYW